jgi:VWFA-related protein
MTMAGRWRSAAILCLAAMGLQVRAQQPVFRSTADAVTVNVAVRRGGRPVTNLKASDFTVRDNGVVQPVVTLSYDTLPVDVTVLLDVSGSVTGAVLDQLRRGVLDLARTMRPADRLQVWTFDVHVRRLTAFGEPIAAIDRKFAEITGGGASAVRDALAVALAAGGAPDRRQFVALFSDGQDTSSVTSTAEVLEVARRTIPAVSVVLAAPVRGEADPAYVDLTAETGGTLVSLRPTDTVGGLLRRALDQYRSSYVLTYVPTGVAPRGTHVLDVRVSRPDVEVRARKTYQLP